MGRGLFSATKIPVGNISYIGRIAFLILRDVFQANADKDVSRVDENRISISVGDETVEVVKQVTKDTKKRPQKTLKVEYKKKKIRQCVEEFSLKKV